MRRLTYTREQYAALFLKGAVKVADRQSDAIAYLYTASNGKPAAAVFFGKSGKPVSRFYYTTPAMREAAVTRAFEGRRASQAAKAARRAERNSYRNDYKAGEILVCSWGYEQTNIDWYEVTDARGAYVTIRKLAAEKIATGDMRGQSAPLPGEYVGEPIRKRASANGIKLTSYSRAYRAEMINAGGVKIAKPRQFTEYA